VAAVQVKERHFLTLVPLTPSSLPAEYGAISIKRGLTLFVRRNFMALGLWSKPASEALSASNESPQRSNADKLADFLSYLYSPLSGCVLA